MRSLVPVGLGRQRLASVLLAIVFLGLEFAWFLSFFLQLLLYHRGVTGAGAQAVWAGLGCALNTWGLARTVKNAHFLWVVGRWRCGEPDELPPTTPLFQARQAWLGGDFARVIQLAKKVEPSKRGDELTQGLARSLALEGRLDEAASVLAEQGGEPGILRWLHPGRSGRPYFTPVDAKWAFRHLWLLVVVGISLLGILSQADAVFRSADAMKDDSFRDQGFKRSSSGPFVFHYHDPAFRDQVDGILQAALAMELDFFERSAAVIPAGAMQIYLCESREEYLERAPYTPSWEQASALPAQDSIYIHRLPPERLIYFEAVLAHELCHLLYHRFYPIQGNDAWLNEGLCDYLGYRFALDRAGMARHAWLDEHVFSSLAGKALPFADFFRMDPHRLSDPQQVALFYRQGFSVVFMLLENYGKEHFLKFLRAYRSYGRDVDRALASVYPTIQNMDDLSAVWGLFYGSKP
jgi:hypothetical protein